MKYEHRAIIDAANREGKAPSELAKELLGHDLLKAMVTAISKPAVPFSKMSEQQQEAVIEDLKAELLPAVSTAIGVIVSQNSHSVRMKLTKLATGPSLQLTGKLDKTQDHIHELMDLASDQSDVLVILHERDYVQGLDAIKAEKDQKPLNLEGDAPKDEPKNPAGKAKAKAADKSQPKPIELTDGLIAGAVEFVEKFQNATHAGLQNQLKIGFDKAEALLAKLEELGKVSAADEKGNRTVIRAEKPKELQPAASTETQPDDGGDLPTDDDGFTIMSDQLFEAARAKVVKDQKVSKGALSVAFDLDDKVVMELIDRLEAEGVISEADEMGGREVFELPD